ncbi:lysophospholipid acyltransferase family protein [Rubrivivax gelatinosus]|uniref:1-acyl-sn-glycerol-3-phosphate acyltransferase n=1 Tax=Rubrivivax gelatinosus TaxID=28068 RepID=A0ABS1DQ90_RUBGE|nr:lysophospholipid acyltransferase family protein [Rubrivivax gelatinosus]MBK1711764.1 1-acyl-sn-glycerol-3-phosphate acyltransferase [Rubrivivax gelatinosus]
MRVAWLLRSVLYWAWLTLTVMPWATVLVLVSAFASRRICWRVCVGWLTLAIRSARFICGVAWRVHGIENVPTLADRHAAVVLAAKHQSTWETFALPMLMPHPIAYVFKRELLWVPFFGWALARLDMIHIDRSRRAEAWNKVAKLGRRLFDLGNWVIMFPEGTRTRRGTQGAYKTGAARLAITAGVPIVPIAVTAGRCWPAKSMLLRPGLVEVSIGAPIASAGRQPDELMRQVEAWIEAEMRRLDPEAYATKPEAQPAQGLGRGGA